MSLTRQTLDSDFHKTGGSSCFWGAGADGAACRLARPLEVLLLGATPPTDLIWDLTSGCWIRPCSFYFQVPYSLVGGCPTDYPGTLRRRKRGGPGLDRFPFKALRGPPLSGSMFMSGRVAHRLTWNLQFKSHPCFRMEPPNVGIEPPWVASVL